MKVGFIGLGRMGAAMAANLLKAGHEVTVYNRSPDKTRALSTLGARVAASVADACRGEAVITMLANDEAVDSVVFDHAGVLASVASGGLHISMSTISVGLSVRLHAAHTAAGQRFIAAPVFGRPEAAAAAQLFIVAAGERATVDACAALFSAIGQRVFYLGEEPSGANLVKLSGNFLIASVIEALGEAMALIGKAGIDQRSYLDLLHRGHGPRLQPSGGAVHHHASQSGWHRFLHVQQLRAGRAGYVTLIANYQPFENPAGRSELLHDGSECAVRDHHRQQRRAVEESLTFQFRFTTVDNGLTVTAGTKTIPVPLSNIGPVSATSMAAQNVAETYTLTLVRGDRRTGTAHAITDATTGSTTFAKPLDNIGAKSIPNYAAYAAPSFITITIPGCSQPGRVFVGQRQDPFVVNLGETFDLVNIKYPVEELAPMGVNARSSRPIPSPASTSPRWRWKFRPHA
jgi:3-hydroxyisobutyrate dehydrogenase-like beta-hydroxyacid dehydrogenase